MHWLAYAISGLVVFAMIAQLASILLAYLQQKSASPSEIKGTPKVTILRPLCGLENNLAETLRTTLTPTIRTTRSSFAWRARATPSFPVAMWLIAQHPHVQARLLIGDDHALRQSQTEQPGQGLARRRGGLGSHGGQQCAASPRLHPASLRDQSARLVSSPPAGIRPEGLAARLECAFLNTLQGRWQLASARLQQRICARQDAVLASRFSGSGRRHHGIGHRNGRGCRGDQAGAVQRPEGSPDALPARPIGRRSFRAVWGRRLRWAKVRRLGFLPIFLPEILLGGVLPFLGALGLMAGGIVSPVAALTLPILWSGTDSCWRGPPAGLRGARRCAGLDLSRSAVAAALDGGMVRRRL